MTQLQKIVAKAKVLKKSHPNTKWTDLIKKASKLVTPATKKTVGAKKKVAKKAVAKKKVGYKDDRISQLRKTTPIIRKYKQKGFTRKDAIKNAMLDAGYMSGTKTHKDTKSHNVRISVVSGISKDALEKIEYAHKQINFYTKNIELLLPYKKFANVKKAIKANKENISSLKKFITQLKKHI